MNPAFLILAVIFIVILWFLLAFLFRPLGKIVYALWKDAKEEINKTELEDEE